MSGSRKKPSREIVEVTIERLGARGDGITTSGGRSLYVPFTAPGDRIRAEVQDLRGEGYSTQMLELLAPGPGRVTPRCRHFGVCGGCALQHLAPDAYDATKRALLHDALARHGLGEVEIRPTFRVEAGTRRRAQLAVRRHEDGRVLVGFSERASHAVVDLVECPVQRSAMVALIPHLRVLASRLLRSGETGAALLTVADTGLDLLMTLPRPPELSAIEELAAFADRSELARLAWRSVDDEAPTIIAQRRPVRVIYGDVAVELPIGSFVQATAEAEREMTRAVCGTLAGADPVADLFAGLGTFAFALARLASVHAVEGWAPAVEAVKYGARMHGLAGRLSAEQRDLCPAQVAGACVARPLQNSLAGPCSRARTGAGERGRAPIEPRSA